MARCDYCGSRILFGGIRQEGLLFCDVDCQEGWVIAATLENVPEHEIEKYIKEVHEGDCPECGGPGPIDVHTSHMVWSAVVVTSWRSKPRICCRSCGVKAKLKDALACFVLGWWGIPWGLLITPVQIVRNLAGVFSSPSPYEPSDQMRNLVKRMMAAQLLEAAQNASQPEQG